MKTELVYRRYPVDTVTERHCLSALALVAEQGHPAFAHLIPRDFYLGLSGFNGWLFSILKECQRRKHTVRYLLLARHREQAALHGEHSLPFALASLFRAVDNVYHGGAISRLPVYVTRLRTVREARRRLWTAERAYQTAWEQWDDEQDDWAQPCDD